jgi:hypothetical protein
MSRKRMRSFRAVIKRTSIFLVLALVSCTSGPQVCFDPREIVHVDESGNILSGNRPDNAGMVTGDPLGILSTPAGDKPDNSGITKQAQSATVSPDQPGRAGEPSGWQREDERAVLVDPMYRDIEVRTEFDNAPPTAGRGLVIDLGEAGRLTVPSRFPEASVKEIEYFYSLGPGFGDAVVVGLDAGSAVDFSQQGLVLVYIPSGQGLVLKAVLPLRERFTRFEQLTVGQNRILVIQGTSGMHFDDLWLYRFQDGNPELLLAKGSAAGIDLREDPATGDVRVWVGIENWADPHWNYATGERLWNVYSWTGTEFAFNAELSTAPETSVVDRLRGYIHAVMPESE